MRRLAALLALVGAIEAAPAAASSPPVAVSASLEPAAVAYGDPVTATVDVRYDPRTVAAASIRVEPSFAPYAVAGPVSVRRLGAGEVRYRYPLLCLTDGCLPRARVRLVRLRPVVVGAVADGRAVSAAARWPALRVASRLSAADRAGRIAFRSPAAPPPPAYRLAPGPLAWGSAAAAGVLALLALALAAPPLARRAARPGERRRSPLALAIAYVRDATRRSDPDRRRALELLAEAAAASGDPGLAAVAAEAAWSARPPSPARAAALADRAAAAEEEP